MHIQQSEYHEHGQTITEDTGTEDQIFQDLPEGVVRRATAEATSMATDNPATRKFSGDTRGQHQIHAGQFR